MNKTSYHVAAVLLLFLTVQPAFAQKPSTKLNHREFVSLHKKLVQPAAIWRTIDWQTSLTTAQHLAIKENKPIFIWAMDGNPLGCT
ncbi:MAG: hypothetical protein AAGA30_05850 [Planctomycetota bacterium]